MSSHYVPNTKAPCLVFPASGQAARHVALIIESLIRQNNSAGRPTVLGLPTGSTPVGLYRELVRLHVEEGLDFSRVVTFNLDEYHPMTADSPHSYRRWMSEAFFDHVNIPRANIHIPDGSLPAEEMDDFCLRYEQKIRRAGGIDLQVLGIGRTGHIGFNEPGSTRHSRTRFVTLDPVTRRDAFLVVPRGGERAAPCGHHGRGDHPRFAQGRADGLRRTQGQDRAEGRRRPDQRPCDGQLPAAASRRHLPARRGRRRRAGRRGPAVGDRPLRLDAGADPQGGHLG